jgi:uncharacterized protein YbaP (TraB family)
MRIFLMVALMSLSFSFSFSQESKIKPTKYPSLLWEITGKGASKPSYLFGTMHVSNKMVFHLSDSFYIAIKNADVVALETNPETWQEDMSRYETGTGGQYGYPGSTASRPSDYLTKNTLKFYPYEKLIELALHSNPAMINSFLYRSYEYDSDFEEDTYLDLYIFQVGRKWGKKVSGVENFDESMKLMKEAYMDAAKDKSSRRRSFEYDEEFSTAKMQEAYRTGNLDLLDTINVVNSSSAAFDEKFLYRRNEIQAANIDSIIKSKSTLFVGVGAAHLPGRRGVIEMLRNMGYKLRPIRMTERDSEQKELVEKVRVPVTFAKQSSADGAFSVSMPGKLYSFMPSFGMVEQQQYADMANGSYYVVTRIQTNASLWGHNMEAVYRKVDSVLYENVPGKILSKKPITRNGYKGFDITNRTRRGDYQRYNIFITPFEVLLFKMSGNGDYVKDGKEGDTFFNSIELKEIKKDWKAYSAVAGGFEVELPHQPMETGVLNRQYMAYDKDNETAYSIIRNEIHNYGFVEEDSFDLNLMEESFITSDFIDQPISRKQTIHQGYPALDARYKLKDGGTAHVRYIIQGPHYYTLVARSKKDQPSVTRFLNSFTIMPFTYGASQLRKDTAMKFGVNSPVALQKESKISTVPPNYYSSLGMEGDEELLLADMGEYDQRLVSNDTTGEKIYITYTKRGKYFYDRDSTEFGSAENFKEWYKDWTIRSNSLKELPGKGKVWDYTLGGKGSSRMIQVKGVYKDGVSYYLLTERDTLTAPSAFIRDFYETFTPFDTVKGIDPQTKKSARYFSDFFSRDTLLHKQAVRFVDMIELDSTDFPQLKKAIQSLTWKEKKYLDVKKSFVQKLAGIPTKSSADFLKEIYYNAGDTVDLQYYALEALLSQKTAYAFATFRDILLNEPPVLNVGSGSSEDYSAVSTSVSTTTTVSTYDEDEEYEGATTGYNYFNGSFFDELYDSTKLTATIFKDILPLINVEDYERPLMYLMAHLVDSNLVSAKDYELYVSKFLIEAKQAYKKQVIAEKNKQIEEAQKDEDDERTGSYTYARTPQDNGNEKLNLYTRLLIPFWNRNPAVPQLMEGLLRSNDKRLKYNTAMLLLSNGKKVPDSLITYFAGLDDFRYELYEELSSRKMLRHFPVAQNNHVALAKSRIKGIRSYDQPDSVVYLDRMQIRHKDKTGFVYFFKYKQKKDDNGWKIASVGLVPMDPKKFSFDELTRREKSEYDFTEWTSTKFERDVPMKEQLSKLMKKLQYAKRKSAAEFYSENTYGDNSMGEFMRD